MATTLLKHCSCAFNLRYLCVKNCISSIRMVTCTRKKSYAKHQEASQNFKGSNIGQNDSFFGFEKVSEEEKAERVRSLFSNVASRYDLMNDAMSGGLHHLWKDYFIQVLNPTPGTKLLDVAGGTGDIAFRFLRAVQVMNEEDKEDSSFNAHDFNEFQIMDESLANQNSQLEQNSQSHVIVFDISQDMLKEGMKKAQNAGFTKGISWVQGNAEELPFSDNSFDAYTCAFGIRNMVHIEKALDEAYRVLKPGGRFLCLEFSHVTNPILERIYDWYSFQVIPVLGQLLAQDWKAYQYLVESIRKFPDQEDYQALLEDAGFHFVTYKNLFCGITAIHTGFKL